VQTRKIQLSKKRKAFRYGVLHLPRSPQYGNLHPQIVVTILGNMALDSASSFCAKRQKWNSILIIRVWNSHKSSVEMPKM
jgi:hypothetical protein